MRWFLTLIAGYFLVTTSRPIAGQAVQIAADPGPMAKQVRTEFLYAWNAYTQYAWEHDELKPLSRGYHDWYSSSLYMTPVDALDTMVLMGLSDEADKTRELIAQNLSFD